MTEAESPEKIQRFPIQDESEQQLLKNSKRIKLEPLPRREEPIQTVTPIVTPQHRPPTRKQYICCLYWRSDVIDLIEEHVRNRWLTAVMFLLLFIYGVFTLFGMPDTTPIIITGVEQQVDMSDIYILNQPIAKYSPVPRAKLGAMNVDETTRFSPLTVTIEVDSFLADRITPESRDCSYETRLQIFGTLEYLRLVDVCQVILTSPTSDSDINGQAVFDDFLVERGPQGRYGFIFTTVDPFTNSKVEGSGFSTYFQNDVSQMRVLEPYPPKDIRIGIPFSQQPRVQLFDINGKPVIGKRVVAFTWHEPSLSSEWGSDSQPYRNKLGLLGGAVSEPSDAEGIASFKDLRITAMVCNQIYLYLSCDNTAIKIWDSPRSPIYSLLGQSPYQTPIELNYDALLSLTIVGNYSTVVEEGKVFAKPITVQLKYNSLAIPGTVAIAVIHETKSSASVRGYREQGKGTMVKDLLKPVTMTVQDSRVTLTDMSFSIYGPIDQFSIIIWANGTYATTQFIQVLTSVKQVAFYSQPQSYMSLAINETATFTCQIRILNQAAIGVPGKSADIMVVDPDTDAVMRDIVLWVDNPLQSFSDEDGIQQLNIHFQYAKSGSIRFCLVALVDGVRSEPSTPILVDQPLTSTYFCGSLQFTSVPQVIPINDEFDLELKVVAQDGSPMSGESVFVFASLDHQGPMFPASLIPQFAASESSVISTTTNAYGIAQFKGMKLASGYEGSVNLFAFTTSVNQLISLLTPVLGSNTNVVTYLSLILATKRYNANAYKAFDEFINQRLLEDGNYQTVTNAIKVYQLTTSVISIDPFEESQTTEDISSLFQSHTTQCEAEKVRVTLTNPLSVLHAVIEDSKEHYQFDEVFRVSLYFLDYSLAPIPQTAYTVEINLLSLPDDLLLSQAQGQDNAQLKVFNLEQMQGQSNSDGKLEIRLKLNSGFVGEFVFALTSQSISSQPITIKSEQRASTVDILTQPVSNFVNGATTATLKMGDYVGTFKVKVKNKAGQGVEAYPVILFLDTEDPRSNDAMVDVSSLFNSDNSVIIQSRRQLTDPNGIATFEKVTVIEVADQCTCIRFRFVVGSIKSESSNLYCFRNNIRVSIVSDIDTTISPNLPFNTPPVVRISIKELSDYQREVGNILAIAPTVYYLQDATGTELLDATTRREYVTEKMFDDWLCFEGSLNCDVLSLKTTVYEAEYLYSFTNLRWKLNKEAQFILSFSGPKSYSNATEIENTRSQVNVTISNLNQLSKYVSLSEEGATISANIDSANELVALISEQLLTCFTKNSSFIAIYRTIADPLSYLIEESSVVCPTLTMEANPKFAELYKLISVLNSQLDASLGVSATSKQTQQISVSNRVTQTLVTSSPPLVVYVGDIFQTSVQVRSENFPIQDAPVQASVVSVGNFISSLSLLSTMEMLVQLNQVDLDMTKLSTYSTKNSEAVLDPARTTQRTDSKGMAYFNLRFITGRPTFVKLQISSKDTQNVQTQQILLKNHIQSVKLITDMAQSADKDMVRANHSTRLSISPTIMITYEPGFTEFAYPKTIQIKFYSYADLEELKSSYQQQQANVTSQLKQQVTYSVTQPNFNSSDQVVEFYESDQLFKNTSKILDNIRRVIMTGGQFTLQTIIANQDLMYTYNRTISKEQFHNSSKGQINTMITLHELDVYFLELGDYQIVVSIDGVESDPSQKIEIVRKDSLADYNVIDAIFGSFIGLLMILVYMINHMPKSYVYGHAYNYTNFYRQKLSFGASARIANLEQPENKQENASGPLFFITRGWDAIECAQLVLALLVCVTCVTLFQLNQTLQTEQLGKPVFSLRFVMYYIAFTMALYLIIDVIIQHARRDKRRCSSWFDPFMENKIEGVHQYMQKLFRNEKIGFTSLRARIKGIFFPFFSWKETCLYYPQKIISAIIIATFAVAYVLYVVAIYLTQLNLVIEKQALLLLDEYNIAITAAISMMKENIGMCLIQEDEFRQLQAPLNTIVDIIIELTYSFNIAFIIAAIVSIGGFILNQYMLLYDFNRRILEMRVGKYTWDLTPRKLDLSETAFFIGVHVSFSVVGMVYTLTFQTLGWLPIFFRFTWIGLWTYKKYVLIILLCPLLQLFLIYILIPRVCFLGDGINTKQSLIRRAFYAFLEILVNYLSIASGIGYGVLRAAVMLFVLSFNTSISYLSIYPQWISRQAIDSDKVLYAYLGTVRLYHLHNNPSLVYFAFHLNQRDKQSFHKDSMLTNAKHKQIRNKFWLAKLLHENPSLRKYRRNTI